MAAPDYDQYRPSPDDLEPLAFLPDEPGIREDHAGLHAMIHALDAGVGRILDSLDEHGLTDETLLVFTSDHGLAFPRAKTTCYDAGIRAPMLWRYPDGLGDSGTVHDALSSHVDFLPTVLDLLDLPIPPGLDGRSYLSVLRGDDEYHRDRVYAFYASGPGGQRAVRTDSWKYIRSYGPQPKPDPGDGYAKYGLAGGAYWEDHYEPPPGEQLYDLDTDPTERENLVGEPAVEDRVTTLRERLKGVMGDAGDPLASAEPGRSGQ